MLPRQKKTSWESQKSACCCRRPRIIFLQNLQKNHFLCFFLLLLAPCLMTKDPASQMLGFPLCSIYIDVFFLTTSLFFCIPVIDIYLYLYEHMPIPVQSAESIALSQPHPNLHSYIFISRKVEIYPSVPVLFWHV